MEPVEGNQGGSISRTRDQHGRKARKDQRRKAAGLGGSWEQEQRVLDSEICSSHSTVKIAGWCFCLFVHFL